jgi:NAD(P)-dependent dehydrogenase (short-subunit alcohol dehydrogenase family)
MSGLIVITGASTGIGRAAAQRMAQRGYDVLAGVRSEAAGDEIRGERIEPVIVDVTKAQDIAALREVVGDRPLAGLVNNAGISISGPLEFFPLEEFKRQFEVNLFSHVAVTQALLEALRRGRGRIVNTGSVGGRTPLPFTSPYAASKAALWATGEALRGELRPWGIHVATVEPGATATEIWRKGAAQANDAVGALPERGRELYGGTLGKVDDIVKSVSAGASPPEKVADVIEHALTSPKPKDRYLVGGDARQQVFARRLLGFRRFERLLEKRMGLG